MSSRRRRRNTTGFGKGQGRKASRRTSRALTDSGFIKKKELDKQRAEELIDKAKFEPLSKEEFLFLMNQRLEEYNERRKIFVNSGREGISESLVLNNIDKRISRINKEIESAETGENSDRKSFLLKENFLKKYLELEAEPKEVTKKRIGKRIAELESKGETEIGLRHHDALFVLKTSRNSLKERIEELRQELKRIESKKGKNSNEWSTLRDYLGKLTVIKERKQTVIDKIEGNNLFTDQPATFKIERVKSILGLE